MKNFYNNSWFLIGVFIFIILIVVAVSIFINHIHNKQSKHSPYSVWAEGRQSYLEYVENDEPLDEIEVICNELMEKHFEETIYFSLFPTRLENLREPFLEGCLYHKNKDDGVFRLVFSDENPYKKPTKQSEKREKKLYCPDVDSNFGYGYYKTIQNYNIGGFPNLKRTMKIACDIKRPNTSCYNGVLDALNDKFKAQKCLDSQ